MVKKGHPLVLHLPGSHRHLLDALFWTNLSLFQFLQTEVTIAMWWCSKQEETGCKVLLKNLAGKKRIIIKKLVILQEPGRDGPDKDSVCVQNEREDSGTGRTIKRTKSHAGCWIDFLIDTVLPWY